MVRYWHTQGDPEVGPQMSPMSRQKPGPTLAETEEIKPCCQCLACVRVCPTGALQYCNHGWALDLGKCHYCLECTVICPNQLIRGQAEVHA